MQAYFTTCTGQPVLFHTAMEGFPLAQAKTVYLVTWFGANHIALGTKTFRTAGGARSFLNKVLSDSL